MAAKLMIGATLLNQKKALYTQGSIFQDHHPNEYGICDI